MREQLIEVTESIIVASSTYHRANAGYQAIGYQVYITLSAKQPKTMAVHYFMCMHVPSVVVCRRLTNKRIYIYIYI